MRSTNICFQEKYKEIDRFLKDARGTEDGVSDYIQDMKTFWPQGEPFIATWKDDYYKLKHIRWVRNQLAHEVSIDSDVCTDEDLEWTNSFYKRLQSGNDSLAQFEQLKRMSKKGKNSYLGSSGRTDNLSNKKRYIELDEKDKGKSDSAILIGLLFTLGLLLVAYILMKIL